MTPNNVSKLVFKRFCKKHDFARHTNRNEFYVGGQSWAFVRSSKGGKPFCRQLYDNQAGFYWHSEDEHRGWYLREDIKVGDVTRIDTKGNIARNAKAI